MSTGLQSARPKDSVQEDSLETSVFFSLIPLLLPFMQSFFSLSTAIIQRSALCSHSPYPAAVEGSALILNGQPAPHLMRFNRAPLKFMPSVDLDLIWVSCTVPTKVRLSAESCLMLCVGSTLQKQDHPASFVH